MKETIIKTFQLLEDSERTITVTTVKGTKYSFVLSPEQILLHCAGSASSQKRDFAIMSVPLPTPVLKEVFKKVLSSFEFEKEEKSFRSFLVSVLTSSRKRKYPCKEWIKLRISGKDREMLIENIFNNVVLKITKSTEPTAPLSVKESEDIKELPKDLKKALEDNKVWSNDEKREEMKKFMAETCRVVRKFPVRFEIVLT